MSDNVRQAAINQIIDLLEEQEIAPDEFTVAMFVEQSGWTDKQARDQLLNLVRDGKLESRLVLMDGRRRYAFRVISTPNP